MKKKCECKHLIAMHDNFGCCAKGCKCKKELSFNPARMIEQLKKFRK